MKFTEVKDYSLCIKKYFSMDQELIDKYHVISGSTLDECCDRTIKDLDKMKTLKFFELENNIGFFGIEGKIFLSTLFVNPEYRTKECMQDIWNTMLSQLDATFFTGFYSKNTRAINYFIKNGAKIIQERSHESNPITILEYRR